MAFGTALREIRITRRISQAALGRLADVDHSTVSRLEAGTRYPTEQMVHSLATALHCTPREKNMLYMQAGFVPAGAFTSAYDLVSWGLQLYDYTDAEIDSLDIAWRAMLNVVDNNRTQGVPA